MGEYYLHSVGAFSYSAIHCTMGRGGGQNKMVSGYMLLTMKTMCQSTWYNEKRPEPIQEMSRTMFFKARSKVFFGISKIIHHIRYPQNDH